MANGKDLEILELVGTSKDGYFVTIELDSLTDLLNKAARQFILSAIQRINAKGGGDTGEMQDIKVIATDSSGDISSIDIGYDKQNPAREYWMFQNYGVKGLRSGQPALSPYKFKKHTVGGEFLEKLIQWYTRNKNYIKNENQKKRLSTTQRKRKSLGNVAENKIKGIAYATGKKIKSKGIKALGFREYALSKSFNDAFYKKLSKALAKDVVLHIRKNGFN
jgi:hypothetical protein